jgi:hypothetical protein
MKSSNFYKIEDKERAKFLKMSAKQFDKYMCKKYSSQFRERNLPMSETCMCWGFCIGKGWYSLLNNLCKRYELIYKLTGIRAYFQQIKEKFGGGRFYHGHDVSESKLSEEDNFCMGKIIDDLASRAEDKSDYTCAECGEYREKMIVVGHWVYDLCPKCFKKVHPDRIKALKEWEKKTSMEEDMKAVIHYANPDEVARLQKIADEFKKAKEKEMEQRRKEWETKSKSKSK